MKTSNKAPRFLIDEELNDQDEIIITDSAINHQIINVLRLKVGDSIVLLDGLGKAFHGKVKVLLKKKSIFSKEKLKFFEDLSTGFAPCLNMVPSILKKDNFEYVLQKCTEIGVSSFHPIISERTEKTELNFERLHKITKEAFEQSERMFMPELHQVETLEDFLTKQFQTNKSETKQLQNSKTEKAKNVFALEFNSPLLKISEFKKITGDVFILVGPEGGWGENDLKLFEKFGVPKISLGTQILRAETASISASALVLLGE